MSINLIKKTGMKILCSQEHYDKVVQYAESIGDTTLQRCLERLKSWEKIRTVPVRLSCIMTLLLIRSVSESVTRMAGLALRADCSIMAGRTSPLRFC